MRNQRILLTVIISMLVTSVIVPITFAEEYETQDIHSGHLIPSTVQVETWDTFNITFFINSGVDAVADVTVRQVLWNGTLAKMTQNPGGTMNQDLNCSWFQPWITGFSRDDGNLNNTDGEISYGPQGFSITETNTGNNSAFRFNMTAFHPGLLHVYIPWTSYAGNSGLEIASVPANFWTNCTIEIHPQNITSLSTSAYNYSVINLTWTKNNASDNVTLCGKAGSYPTSPTDSVLYNGSNLAYNHSSLDNCTTYYYRAWSYNESCGWHSITYMQATGTTWCYTNISILGINPTNNTKITNCTYSQTVNVTIRNSQGRTCLYWINASNSQSTSGTVLNNSISLPLTSLSHNATYWWNVTASEQGVYGSSDSTQGHYHFRTGEGGGTAPSGSTPYPNGITDVPISPTSYAITVTDADADPTNVSFFFADGTFIGNHNMTYSSNSANVTYTTALNTNTTCQWYTLLNDTSGCGTSTRYPSSGYFSFTTQEPLVTLTKEWNIFSNNTIIMWINATNVGETNLTNGYINETWAYDYLTLVGATQTANGSDPGMYNITWLNKTGYPGHWFNLTMYFGLRNPIPNATTLSDIATIYFNGSALNSITPTTLPTMSFYATKEANMSVIYWNNSDIKFTINITNTGDFYMNWTQVNETYSPNLTYWTSDIAPDGTSANVTFNITTQIAPGGTTSFWIKMNVTGAELINGSTLYNNITIHCNDTSTEIEAQDSMPIGAITTEIRVSYISQLTDVTTIGNNVLAILGILLIIGAVMLIVTLLYKQGYLGGGK